MLDLNRKETYSCLPRLWQTVYRSQRNIVPTVERPYSQQIIYAVWWVYCFPTRMSFHTEDTWEHSAHARRFLVKFVSIWADIARGQPVCMYRDASILVVGVLTLKVKKWVPTSVPMRRKKERLTAVITFFFSAYIAKRVCKAMARLLRESEWLGWLWGKRASAWR